jgi:predicted small integral membrane protein
MAQDGRLEDSKTLRVALIGKASWVQINVGAVLRQGRNREAGGMVNPSKLEHHERVPGRTSLIWGRLAIVVLLGIEALYFSLVAFGNITDYYTNFAFVKGVMSMDTTFQDKDFMWRAVDNVALYHIVYIGIILWESATAVVCWAATVLGARLLRSSASFERAQRLSVVGLLMSILLWAGAFLTIGGEWFAMWQSEKWNGTEAALRNFMVSGIALVIVLLVANGEGRSIDRESEQSETPN